MNGESDLPSQTGFLQVSNGGPGRLSLCLSLGLMSFLVKVEVSNLFEGLNHFTLIKPTKCFAGTF